MNKDDLIRELAQDVTLAARANPRNINALANSIAALGIDTQEGIRDELEVEALKTAFETSKGLPDASIIKALGPDYGPMIEGVIKELRAAKGEAKRRVLKKIRGMAHRLGRQQDEEKRKRVERAERIERYDRIASEVHHWLHAPLVLERLNGSHFGRLLEAEKNYDLFASAYKGREQEYVPDDLLATIYGQSSVFVVEHDWARAFESAPDVFTGLLENLPDTSCTFEFKISGRIVIVLVTTVGNEGDGHPCILPVVQAKDGGWVMLGNALSCNGQLGIIETLNDGIQFYDKGDSVRGNFKPITEDQSWFNLLTLLDRQIRAICVALDAQVAVKSAQRMPYRSNLPKAERRAKPFYEYHTVSLARRSARLEAREPDGIEVVGPKRRLHFRRGHWRHFEGWKTWVNWCLVGDPDLGFVDKHYKL